MSTTRPNRIALAIVSLAILFSTAVDLWARAADGSTNAGTIISNRAEASYTDDTGKSYTTVSPTVTLTVSLVASLVVTPDETSPSDTTAPHERVTRLFRVCNTGNNADSFTVTRAGVNTPAAINALYFDNDGSGTLNAGDAPITLNETSSPQLAPAGCIGVLAVIDTKDVAAQSTITINITARSNATGAVNGRGEDTGTIINVVGQGPRFTDPGNPNLPPSKLVNCRLSSRNSRSTLCTVSMKSCESTSFSFRPLNSCVQPANTFHAGTNTIEASFGAAPPDWTHQLESLAGVERVTGDAHVARIATDNGPETTTAMLTAAAEAGVSVLSLAVESTSLDDVFVHYTGRQLRDALQEPSAADRSVMINRGR